MLNKMIITIIFSIKKKARIIAIKQLNGYNKTIMTEHRVLIKRQLNYRQDDLR